MLILCISLNIEHTGKLQLTRLPYWCTECAAVTQWRSAHWWAVTLQWFRCCTLSLQAWSAIVFCLNYTVTHHAVRFHRRSAQCWELLLSHCQQLLKDSFSTSQWCCIGCSSAAVATVDTYVKPSTHWWQSQIWHGRLYRRFTKSTVSLWPRTHWWQSQIWHGRLCRRFTKSTVSLWPRTHWQQSRKDVRHLGDKRRPLTSTQSTSWPQCRLRQTVEFDLV